MRQAQFFYHNKNAPKPNRPNHIGTSVLIEYRDKLLLEHRTDSETWAIIGGGLKKEEKLAGSAVRGGFEEKEFFPAGHRTRDVFFLFSFLFSFFFFSPSPRR